MSEPISNSTIESIKIKGYCSLAFYFWGIPVLGWLLAILGIIANVLVVIALRKMSGSTTLFRNFLVSIFLYIIAVVMITFPMSSILESSGNLDIEELVLTLLFAIVVIGIPWDLVAQLLSELFRFTTVISIVIFVVAFYFKYQYIKELATITNQRYFLYAFFASIIGAVTTIILIGFLFFLAALILEIMAWNRLSEIRKAD